MTNLQELRSMTNPKTPTDQRHPSTEHLLKTLKPNPNLEGVAADVVRLISDTAQTLSEALQDGQEFSAGLRKLREAKDCFVLQSLEDERKGPFGD